MIEDPIYYEIKYRVLNAGAKERAEKYCSDITFLINTIESLEKELQLSRANSKEAIVLEKIVETLAKYGCLPVPMAE